MEGGFDDFLSLNNQLATLGLSLKQIPGTELNSNISHWRRQIKLLGVHCAVNWGCATLSTCMFLQLNQFLEDKMSFP